MWWLEGQEASRRHGCLAVMCALEGQAPDTSEPQPSPSIGLQGFLSVRGAEG